MGSGKAEPIQADCRWNDSSQQSSNKKYVNFKVLEHKSRQWVFIKIFTSSNCWSSEWPLFFGVRSWWGRKCTHHISGRAMGEEQGGAPATIPTPGSPAQPLQGPGGVTGWWKQNPFHPLFHWTRPCAFCRMLDGVSHMLLWQRTQDAGPQTQLLINAQTQWFLSK